MFKNIMEVVRIKNLYSIGEVSKIKKITIKALRYYHKVGILIPKYIDEESGYRYYSLDQFVHIDVIKGCRELGTSIAELQEIFKECNTDRLLEFLQIKKIEAQENINKMKGIINNIDLLSNSIETSKKILKYKDISIKYFEKRYVVTSECKEAGNLKELLYYSDLDKLITDKCMKTTMNRGIVYNIDFNNNDIEPKYVFNEIKYDKNIILDKNINIIPEGNYLTLVYNKENENMSRIKIMDYIKKNNLNVKEIIEIELFNDIFNTESYNCQIQIFLEK